MYLSPVRSSMFDPIFLNHMSCASIMSTLAKSSTTITARITTIISPTNSKSKAIRDELRQRIRSGSSLSPEKGNCKSRNSLTSQNMTTYIDRQGWVKSRKKLDYMQFFAILSKNCEVKNRWLVQIYLIYNLLQLNIVLEGQPLYLRTNICSYNLEIRVMFLSLEYSSFKCS